MRNYNEISALWRAPLFSKSFYTDVALNWRGIGVLFLLLLAFLTWLPQPVQWARGLTQFLEHEAPTALKDFPAIKIEKGIASSPVDQPYIMKDDKGHPVFVLDTTGKTKLPSDEGARLMLTQTEMLQEDVSGRVQHTPLKGFPDMTIDGPTVIGWGRTIRNLIVPVGWPFFALSSFVLHLVMALLLAALGMAFNAGFGGRLTYAAVLRLTAVSMAGPLLLYALVTIFFSAGCGGWFLFHALILVYLGYGVKVANDALAPLAAFPVDTAMSQSPLPPLPAEPGTPDEQSPFP